jgi:hypothetical protein
MRRERTQALMVVVDMVGSFVAPRGFGHGFER